MPGLPIGTRGGVAVSLHVRAERRVRNPDLARRAAPEGNIVSGLRQPASARNDGAVDREPVATFTIQKSADSAEDTMLDAI